MRPLVYDHHIAQLTVIADGLNVATLACTAMQRFTALPRFTDEQLRRLASKMEYKEFEGGTQIIIQGATDNCFYVLKSGSCSVMVDG